MAPGVSTNGKAGNKSADVRFAKAVLLTNGLVPLALLSWDAYRNQLGVNGVNYALHTTGLLSLIFLVTTLAVTPLRKLTGWNSLIAYRRALGLFAFLYACIHLAIFFLFDRAGSVSSTVHEIISRRYLQIGTAGLLVMVPLAITSTNRMVMRLGAKRWKRLHRLAYVAAIAGATHYLLLVKSDLRQPSVFAAALALLLGFRLVQWLRKRRTAPLPAVLPSKAVSGGSLRPWTGELVVSKVVQETPDVRTFHLANPDGGDLPFVHRAGQYLNISFLVGGRKVNRSYTIASSPSRRDHCEITVKRAHDGYASHHLHDVVRPGDRVRISAPAGRFTFDGTESERVVLVGGGVGITPLMSIVRYLTDGGWKGAIHLFFSVRRQSDVIFGDELTALAARFPNLHLHFTLTQEGGSMWSGRRGHIDGDWLLQTVPELRESPVLICGPAAMNSGLGQLLVDGYGLAPTQVRTEAFVSATSSAGGETVGASPGSVLQEPPVAAPPDMVSVEFVRSRRRLAASTAATLLEIAEGAGLELPFECRAGICGQCKTRLASGQVRMDADDALTTREKQGGLILLCQAHPLGDVVLDA